MKRTFLYAAAGLLTAASFAAAQPVRPPASGTPGPQIGGPTAAAMANFNRGQIVNVNAQSGMVTVRIGTGNTAREQQFRVANDARFFGPDRRPLTNGLA